MIPMCGKQVEETGCNNKMCYSGFTAIGRAGTASENPPAASPLAGRPVGPRHLPRSPAIPKRETVMRPFPFSALVGQSLLKKGLLVNAVDPSIGGVLLRGEKGTGKTTAVRSFAAVLPPKEVVRDCRFGCVKGSPPCDECREREGAGERLSYEERPVEVVDLPLNASEDRVVGSLDLEAALREGSRKFEMGVLGKANGNVLYIDEVNLLDDHVVDVLLDVAVSGVNVVMREGVSYRHPSRFLLVGTMNPEEGELRPQLLDRFGLCVEVSGEKDLSMRRRIVERVLAFERDDDSFRERWAREDAALRERLVKARETLPAVEVSEQILGAVVEVVADLGVAGHRGDITILKCAKALAAVRGLEMPDEECLADAFRLSLPHRLKEDPFDEASSGRRRLDAVLSRFGVQPQRTILRPGPGSEV